jgi:hypothetical protein
MRQRRAFFQFAATIRSGANLRGPARFGIALASKNGSDRIKSRVRASIHGVEIPGERRELMAQLDLSIAHGQPMDRAAEKFEAAILEAEARFGQWIHRVDWSEDRHAALLSGPGYEVRLWFDARDLHAQGRIPLAWKLFEGALRNQVIKSIGR